MRIKIFCPLIITMFVNGVACAGFLEPVGFPKTAADLSFVDRMALNAAGYEPYESEYDENGKCISGCSYALPNIEDEIAAMERYNAMVNTELVAEYGYHETENGEIVPPAGGNGYAPLAPSFPNDTAGDAANCSIKNTDFMDTDLPYRSPVGRVLCITSDYGVARKLAWNKTTKIHYGIDLAAPIGTPIYAPANGVVVTVFNMNKTCGNGIIISHPSNYRTQYCHLNTVSVSRGDQVSSGCLIGYSGNTGQSTGPHLHYAVHKVTADGTMAVNPRKFIEPEHKMCR